MALLPGECFSKEFMAIFGINGQGLPMRIQIFPGFQQVKPNVVLFQQNGIYLYPVFWAGP